MADKFYKGKITAGGREITVLSVGTPDDFISLTDIAKYKNPEEPNIVVANWLRNRNTIEYLGLWEQLNNPNFKPLEFEGFISAAGANAFTLSPMKWINATNAKGLPQSERIAELNRLARLQLAAIIDTNSVKRLKEMDDDPEGRRE